MCLVCAWCVPRVHSHLLLTSPLLTSVCLQLQVPEGCSRYTVELSRPLGLVLEEKGSQIFVGEVQEGGLAAREGTIQPGDILISTSGITYSKEAGLWGGNGAHGRGTCYAERYRRGVCEPAYNCTSAQRCCLLHIQPLCMRTWCCGYLFR